MYWHCVILLGLFVGCVGIWGWGLAAEKVSDVCSQPSLFSNLRNGSKQHRFYYSEREVRGGSVLVVSA